MWTFNRTRIHHILILTMAFAVVTSIVASEPWIQPQFRRGASAKYNQISQALEKEISQSRSAWSGIYERRTADRFEVLTIAPDSGWIYEVIEIRHSTSDLYDRNYGGCTFDDQWVELVPAFPSKFLERMYCCISVGGERFLVSQYELENPNFAPKHAIVFTKKETR